MARSFGAARHERTAARRYPTRRDATRRDDARRNARRREDASQRRRALQARLCPLVRGAARRLIDRTTRLCGDGSSASR